MKRRARGGFSIPPLLIAAIAIAVIPIIATLLSNPNSRQNNRSEATSCRPNQCQYFGRCQLTGYRVILEGQRYICAGNNQWKNSQGAVLPGSPQGPVVLEKITYPPINPTFTRVTSGSEGGLSQEAENGSLLGYTKVQDPMASGGWYINETPDSDATATYNLTVGGTTAQDFYLYLRQNTSGSDNDSFSVQFDTGANLRVDTSTMYGAWAWQKARFRDDASGETYTKVRLSAGQHKLVISGRDKNNKLDSWEITPNGSAH